MSAAVGRRAAAQFLYFLVAWHIGTNKQPLRAYRRHEGSNDHHPRRTIPQLMEDGFVIAVDAYVQHYL